LILHVLRPTPAVANHEARATQVQMKRSKESEVEMMLSNDRLAHLTRSLAPDSRVGAGLQVPTADSAVTHSPSDGLRPHNAPIRASRSEPQAEAQASGAVTSAWQGQSRG
jgi:hypothetical protein